VYNIWCVVKPTVTVPPGGQPISPWWNGWNYGRAGPRHEERVSTPTTVQWKPVRVLPQPCAQQPSRHSLLLTCKFL